MAQGRALSRYVITPAGPADAEALGRLHVATWRETYPGLLPDAYLARMSPAAHGRRFAKLLDRLPENSALLIAADADGVVGYVEAGPSRRRVKGEAEVATLYVLRTAQGRGLGRRLMEDAARTMEGYGATSLVASVLAGNAPARKFYEHLGGTAEPPREEVGPGGARVSEVAYRWARIADLG